LAILLKNVFGAFIADDLPGHLERLHIGRKVVFGIGGGIVFVATLATVFSLVRKVDHLAVQFALEYFLHSVKHGFLP
jgi:hypothetical protein